MGERRDQRCDKRRQPQRQRTEPEQRRALMSWLRGFDRGAEERLDGNGKADDEHQAVADNRHRNKGQ